MRQDDWEHGHALARQRAVGQAWKSYQNSAHQDFEVRWLDIALNIGRPTSLATRQITPQESAVQPVHSKALGLRF
jgi:hypothetical protein